MYSQKCIVIKHFRRPFRVYYFIYVIILLIFSILSLIGYLLKKLFTRSIKTIRNIGIDICISNIYLHILPCYFVCDIRTPKYFIYVVFECFCFLLVY